MSEISREEMRALLEDIHKTGGSPEFVTGRCPGCGTPFLYEFGLRYGHFLSDCPKREPK